MAPLGKFLPLKCEDLSLGPKNSCKRPGVVTRVCDLSTREANPSISSESAG